MIDVERLSVLKIALVDDAEQRGTEEELARAYLKRKRLKKPENDKEAARIFRGLMRAGFGPDHPSGAGSFKSIERMWMSVVLV